MKPYRETGKCFEENKVVKSMEQKIWINSKTLNSAFVWCEAGMQISEPVIHLGR